MFGFWVLGGLIVLSFVFVAIWIFEEHDDDNDTPDGMC